MYTFDEAVEDVHGLYDAFGESTVESIEIPFDTWGPFRIPLDKAVVAPNLRKVIHHKTLPPDIILLLASTMMIVEHR